MWLILIRSGPLGTKNLSAQKAGMTSSVTSQANLQLKTVPITYHLCLGAVDISIPWFLYMKNGHKWHMSQNDCEDQVRYHLWKHPAWYLINIGRAFLSSTGLFLFCVPGPETFLLEIINSLWQRHFLSAVPYPTHPLWAGSVWCANAVGSTGSKLNQQVACFLAAAICPHLNQNTILWVNTSKFGQTDNQANRLSDCKRQAYGYM